LKVADSSYLVEGLLKDKDLFEEEDVLLTLDLAVYEVVNSIWKHEFLLKDIKNGVEYLSVLYDLIEARKIQLFHINKEASETAYSLSVKSKRPLYDTAFIALALELHLDLVTFDTKQAELFHRECRQFLR
jgi:predicted nucleic acid-binding protein